MTNPEIEIRDFTNGNIEICRELCNALMHHQARQSTFGTEVLQSMSYDNRLKPGFERAAIKKLLVAFHHNKAIGYIFRFTF